MQYGGLLAVRNRRVSILQSNPLWGPRRNLVVPVGMVATAIIAVINIYGPGLQRVFDTTPIPGKFWGIPFAFAVGILAMDEGRKLLVRTYPNVSAQCISVRGPLADEENSPLWRKQPGRRNMPNLSLSHCEPLHDLYYIPRAMKMLSNQPPEHASHPASTGSTENASSIYELLPSKYCQRRACHTAVPGMRTIGKKGRTDHIGGSALGL